jgi:hypothetical protein
MNLDFSNNSPINYVKLFPVKNNRVLFLKRLIFNRGIENIVSIMLAVTCKIHSAAETIPKPLRQLFLGNYRETFFKGRITVLLNESIVLPVECELIEFNFISQIPFDLQMVYDLK